MNWKGEDFCRLSELQVKSAIEMIQEFCANENKRLTNEQIESCWRNVQ